MASTYTSCSRYESDRPITVRGNNTNVCMKCWGDTGTWPKGLW